MQIAILGAGGVGGYDGAVLSRAGNEVQLLARGKHLDAIQRDGLRVTEADGTPGSPASRRPMIRPPCAAQSWSWSR